MTELILLYFVKTLGFCIRRLPLRFALKVGRGIGLMGYYFDIKHKSQAYANLKRTFAEFKSPQEINVITKDLFKHYGQSFIELLRIPLFNKPEDVHKLVKVEGVEHVAAAIQEGKGLILLAMHNGSWEMANLACATLGHPYKVIVKPQTRYSRLDDLLNKYRSCGGSIVINRGMGTRDFIRSLDRNEIIGMVVDQGGKEGVMVSLFGRQTPFSVGAIRMGLKKGVPICFSVIHRQENGHHRMIIHKPLALENTGHIDTDIVVNLHKIAKMMEYYICEYPSEYMWFYKLWKYSRSSIIAVLSDGKAGHLNQSRLVARQTRDVLRERGVEATIKEVDIDFKTLFTQRLFSVLSLFSNSFINQGRLEFLDLFLKPASFESVVSIHPDVVISAGASVAGMNSLLSLDSNAKNIAVMKPGFLPYDRFDLIVLPQHDVRDRERKCPNIVKTNAAPNLVDEQYLKDQEDQILSRFSHLKGNLRLKIGVFIGGPTKHVFISDQQIKVLIHQLKEVATGLKASVLVTTSRRTPRSIEKCFLSQFKKHPACELLIIANKENVSAAVGGILSLSDIVIVSGDSISMISEAATAGKKTIVFTPKRKHYLSREVTKHELFVSRLNERGYVLSTNVSQVGRSIFDFIKNKIQTRPVNDRKIIFDAIKELM
ncbi:MAG: mitochondrial fission ELM1 family protein [Candidatus Omnitrophica bacterium]|nr:mitochondrial fission ELM1 family protein [Candidatus Omnitrophota bacterium]